MGSAALAAAVPAVLYPGKETRISCKGNIKPHIIKYDYLVLDIYELTA